MSLLTPVLQWSTRVGLGFSLGFFHIGYLYSMLPYWIEQNLDSPVSQDNKDSQLMVSVVEATCILTREDVSGGSHEPAMRGLTHLSSDSVRIDGISDSALAPRVGKRSELARDESGALGRSCDRNKTRDHRFFRVQGAYWFLIMTIFHCTLLCFLSTRDVALTSLCRLNLHSLATELGTIHCNVRFAIKPQLLTINLFPSLRTSS